MSSQKKSPLRRLYQSHQPGTQLVHSNSSKKAQVKQRSPLSKIINKQGIVNKENQLIYKNEQQYGALPYQPNPEVPLQTVNTTEIRKQSIGRQAQEENNFHDLLKRRSSDIQDRVEKSQSHIYSVKAIQEADSMLEASFFKSQNTSYSYTSGQEKQIREHSLSSLQSVPKPGQKLQLILIFVMLSAIFYIFFFGASNGSVKSNNQSIQQQLNLGQD